MVVGVDIHPDFCQIVMVRSDDDIYERNTLFRAEKCEKLHFYAPNCVFRLFLGKEKFGGI